MADFVESEGLPFLAHLLKRLSDEFVRGCAVWYPEAGLRSSPRNASTLHALDRLGPLSVTEIAETIRQSHPVVIDWIKQLSALGLVETAVDPRDRRRTIVALTDSGRREAEIGRRADAVIASAYRSLLDEAGADIFAALWCVEKANREKPFEQRLRDAARKIGSINEN